jgi:hypothetical protein
MTRRLITSALVLAAALTAGLATTAGASAPAPTVTQALKAAAAPRSELVRTRSVNFRGFRVSRFQQRVAGYPVIGGEATVVSGPGVTPRVAADATSAVPAKVELAAPSARVSRTRAIAAARAAGNVRSIRRGDRASAGLAVDPRHGDALVWRVELPAERPMRDLEVLVDAASGRVLSKANLLQDFTGKAKIYVPNPPVEQGGYAGLGKGPAADHRGKDTPRLTALREPVKLPRMSGNCLKGKFVEARYDKQAKAVCRRSRNWNGVTRSNDQFHALMAYFHIDRTQAYIQSLGFSKATHFPIDDRRQHVIVDFPVLPRDNSFYSPQDRMIRYGPGGVPDAEDADVIIHEYGHSIQDDQDPGFGCHTNAFCQSGAIGEGFGDYNSAMMTLQLRGLRDPTQAASCIFDWDGVVGWGGSVAPCGRVADGSDGVETLPQAMTPGGPCGGPTIAALDIHCVGEVWSHGLLDLRLGPMGEAINVDLLASQSAYVNSETFPNAVGALVDADKLLHAGANVAAICAEMRDQRGIVGAPGC